MFKPLYILLVLLIGVNVLGEEEIAEPALHVTCAVQDGDYTVSLVNLGTSPVGYWIYAPDAFTEAFRKVPGGAECFVSPRPYHAGKSFSSLVVQNDFLKLPVRLAKLAPGTHVEFKFGLNDLWWPWIGPGDLAALKSSQTAFMIRVKVFLDEKLARYLVADSAWTAFDDTPVKYNMAPNQHPMLPLAASITRSGGQDAR